MNSNDFVDSPRISPSAPFFEENRRGGAGVSDGCGPPPSYASVVGKDQVVYKTNIRPKPASDGYLDIPGPSSADYHDRLEPSVDSYQHRPEASSCDGLQPLAGNGDNAATNSATLPLSPENESELPRDRPVLRRTLMHISFALGVACIVVGSLNLTSCENKIVPAFPLVMGICILIKLFFVWVRSYPCLGDFSSVVLLFFVIAAAVVNTKNGLTSDRCALKTIRWTLYVTIALIVPMTVYWCWALCTCYDEPAFFCDPSVEREYLQDSQDPQVQATNQYLTSRRSLSEL